MQSKENVVILKIDETNFEIARKMCRDIEDMCQEPSPNTQLIGAKASSIESFLARCARELL